MIFFGHTRVITPFTEGERCSMASLTGETLHIIKINKETHATIFVSFSSSSSSGQKYVCANPMDKHSVWTSLIKTYFARFQRSILGFFKHCDKVGIFWGHFRVKIPMLSTYRHFLYWASNISIICGLRNWCAKIVTKLDKSFWPSRQCGATTQL